MIGWIDDGRMNGNRLLNEVMMKRWMGIDYCMNWWWKDEWILMIEWINVWGMNRWINDGGMNRYKWLDELMIEGWIYMYYKMNWWWKDELIFVIG